MSDETAPDKLETSDSLVASQTPVTGLGETVNPDGSITLATAEGEEIDTIPPAHEEVRGYNLPVEDAEEVDDEEVDDDGE